MSAAPQTPMPPPMPRRPKSPRQGLVAFSVFAVVVGMLGMSFAAVPLYRAFCAATGFAGTTQVRRVAPKEEGKRVLTVHLDANVAPGLALDFAPEVLGVSVRTGQTATVFLQCDARPGWRLFRQDRLLLLQRAAFRPASDGRNAGRLLPRSGLGEG
jgi:hypothetical protein